MHASFFSFVVVILEMKFKNEACMYGICGLQKLSCFHSVKESSFPRCHNKSAFPDKMQSLNCSSNHFLAVGGVLLLSLPSYNKFWHCVAYYELIL